MLVSKKRYVGYKYESPSQREPILDAKGIEMVRRDGCPALVNVMEKTIHILFSSCDLSLVRSYLERMWFKMWQGTAPVRDFIFAKEVRLGTYKQLPLAALVATRAMTADRRAEPVYAMRVPYVIVDGAPKDRLFDRVITPHQLLAAPHLYRLSPSYYCERVINPALARLLDIAGVDIKIWYAAMPRPQKRVQVSLREAHALKGDGMMQWRKHGRGTDGIASKLIDDFYASNRCPICARHTKSAVCSRCAGNPQLVTFALLAQLQDYQKQLSDAVDICRQCVMHDTSLYPIADKSASNSQS